MAQDKLIWKIVLDFAILLCVGAPLLAFVIWGEAPKVGFFEDDRSLRLPYKEETISETWLAAVGFAFMVATVVIIEFVRDRKGRSVGEKFLCGSLIPGWLWESYITIGVFTFGAACQQLTAEVTKYVTGRLRPHFYAVCRPVYDTSLPANSQGYIQEYTCSNTEISENRISQMRLSFPSAHASFAMYVAVFWILYIQIKGKWRGSKLLRHGMQLAVFLAAWYVGLSRVVEHFHHWEDTAFGFFIGIVYGVLVIPFILKPKRYVPSAWQDSAPQENMLPRPVLAR
ncbi:putative phosphatidate phosphatase [Choristoneura fumiferana]|uniref:putative phosphatidate phosphatase n=1 Tax=Choristoneura fumiferana TaxID=7141 RepID=UPI003D15A8F9